MTLNQLIYFKTVAEYENYHRAAEELYVSQPSLSRSISGLEKELGLRLFQKKGRGVCMTKAGQIFLIYAIRILDECDNARNKMKELSSKGGRIDVGFVSPLADHYMPRMVRKFLDKDENADVRFSFVQNNTLNLVKQLKAGVIDVGFGGYVTGESSLEFFPVQEDKLVMITPKNTKYDGLDKLPIEIVLDNRVIGYEAESLMGINLNRFYNRMELYPKSSIECPDERSIKSFVSEGFGIAIVPLVDVIRDGSVNIHEIEDVNIYHQMYMFWEKNRYYLPSVERFIEYMKQQSEAARKEA